MTPRDLKDELTRNFPQAKTVTRAKANNTSTYWLLAIGCALAISIVIFFLRKWMKR